jgi:N-methylhydantoinase B
MGAAGAKSHLVDEKVGRVEINRGGNIELARTNILETIKPGQTITNMNPGGGGYGDPRERPVEKVIEDVRNGLVSIRGAKEDYGVVFKNAQGLEIDDAATQRLRKI